MKIHTDDRRCAWLEVFKDALPDGQLNVTTVWPGAILAWHRHEHQDDRMLVISGTLKVGIWWPGKPEDVIWEVLTPLDPRECLIPRGAWHGYQNIGHEPAVALSWLNQPYNAKDEHRLHPHHPDTPSWTRKDR